MLAGSTPPPMRIVRTPSCDWSCTACETVLKNTTFFVISTSIQPMAARQSTATMM
ncbi:MAG: hypothetical protein QOF28_1249 [Actinomycetota bacterium]|nr:hypothetical protein [Actinomycetota bacterium]